MKPCCALAKEDMEREVKAYGGNEAQAMSGFMWQIAYHHIRYCDALHQPSEPEKK